MARFTFALQSVLEQREIEERTCQMELAASRAVQVALEADLSRLNEEIVGANESMRNEHLIGRINVNVISTHRRFLIAMRQSVVALAERIAAARMDVEAKQRKLADAAKSRKVIEHLRDKQKARWTADENRKELAIADDVGMQIAFHNLQADAAAVGGSVS